MNKALPLLSGVLLFVSAAKAQPQVTATISAESIGSESYDYTVTVDNGSAYSYDAIWFSFLPHLENFLPSKPTSVTPPSGWEGTITSSSDGYGIEFLPLNNSITPLLPNSSVIFSFDSPDLPSVIAETWMDPKSPRTLHGFSAAVASMWNLTHGSSRNMCKPFRSHRRSGWC
jgi:hypothetical protein